MLLQQSIKQLKEYTNISSFRCDGRSYKGCQSNAKASSDPKSELYHCFTCGFDYCKQCYGAYGHTHPMKEVEFEEISKLKKYTENNGEWKCNASIFEGCEYGADKHFNGEDDVTYCCRQCDFDLCSKCIKAYKA